MIFLQKALMSLVGIATAAQAAGFGEIGQSIPDCGGLKRFEKVLARISRSDGLYRSSAPYYEHADSDQRITDETILCLQAHGITQVIAVNSQANNQDIRRALEQHGIAYTAIPVADYEAPTLEQVEEAWRAFRTHRAGTLVWCGYGHGRTGTIITALQMYAQNERGDVQTWDHLQYWHDNWVESEVQYALLDQVYLGHIYGYENQVEAPVTPMDLDEGTQRRLMANDFDGLDCGAVLGLALSYSMFANSHMHKRSPPLTSHTHKRLLSSNPREGPYCTKAKEVLLRQQCGVSDYSRPSPMLLTNNRIRVFSHNTEGNLIVTGWEHGQWWDYWANRQGNISSEPAAMFIREGDLRVYARSKDNHLMESAFYDDKWHPWTDLDGSPYIDGDDQEIDSWASPGSGPEGKCPTCGFLPPAVADPAPNQADVLTRQQALPRASLPFSQVGHFNRPAC